MENHGAPPGGRKSLYNLYVSNPEDWKIWRDISKKKKFALETAFRNVFKLVTFFPCRFFNDPRAELSTTRFLFPFKHSSPRTPKFVITHTNVDNYTWVLTPTPTAWDCLITIDNPDPNRHKLKLNDESPYWNDTSSCNFNLSLLELTAPQNLG